MMWYFPLISLAALFGCGRCAYNQHQYDGISPSYRGYNGPPVIPVILPGGYIADTEEVAAAKDAHFNAYAQVASSVKDDKYDREENYEVNQISYNRPSAHIAQNRVSYNHEAPQQYEPYHHQAPAPQKYYAPLTASKEQYQEPLYQPKSSYRGPPVVPVILPNGYIADTHDVSAAKEEHFAAVERAQAAVARAQARLAKDKASRYTGEADYTQRYYESDDGSSGYQTAYQQAAEHPTGQAPRLFAANTNYHAKAPYKGPVVLPVVLASGHIADTQEVAAAKVAHLKLLIQASERDLSKKRQY